MAEQDVSAESSLDTGLERFPRLPPEIRIKVFKSLVPDPLPIGSRIPLPADVRASRGALLNLCYTSKECYALALPFLYRYIIITDYAQMAHLLVCLMFQKGRRAWIHRLAVLVEFDLDAYEHWVKADILGFVGRTIWWVETDEIQQEEPGMLDTFNAIKFVLPKFMDLIAGELMMSEEPPLFFEDWQFHSGSSVSSLRRLTEHDGDLNGIFCCFLQLLLQMQINTKDILITNSSFLPQPLCSAESQDKAMSYFRRDQTQPGPAPDNPLRNLLSIRKQAGTHQLDRLNPDPLAPEYLGTKDWEFLRDSGFWFFSYYMGPQGWPLPVEPPRDLTVFSHVTDLALYQSMTHPAELRIILGSCRSLKALCYTTNALDWSYKFIPLPPVGEEEGTPVPTLQQALDEVRATLTELRLGWTSWRAVLTDDEEEAVRPHRVDVSSFPRLTSFDIDPAFVL